MQSLTPVLFVPAIEPCLELWVDRLGFAKVVEVPEGDALGFVILVKGPVSVMYQSYASLEKDVPALLDEGKASRTFVYTQVDDLDEIAPKLEGFEVVVPDRTTFYGAREIGIREPGGHVVVFSQHSE